MDANGPKSDSRVEYCHYSSDELYNLIVANLHGFENRSQNDDLNLFSLENHEVVAEEKTKFFLEIFVPLFRIVNSAFTSVSLVAFYDVIDKIERATPLACKSEDVYEFLQELRQIDNKSHSYRNRVHELLYFLYPQLSQNEPLRILLVEERKIEFCIELAKQGDIRIYTLCLFYSIMKKAVRKIRNRLSDRQSIFRDTKIPSEIRLESAFLYNHTLTFLKIHTSYMLEVIAILKFIGEKEYMMRYRDIEKHELFLKYFTDELSSNTLFSRYNNYVKSFMTTNSSYESGLLRDDLGVYKIEKLTKEIKLFLAKGCRENRKIEAAYQKTVFEVLKDGKLLNSSLIKDGKINNKKKAHEYMTKFIKEELDLDNITYSDNFNKSISVSDHKNSNSEPDKKRYLDYEEFLSGCKEIIGYSIYNV